MPILLYPVGVDVLESGLSLQLQPYSVYASKKGSGKFYTLIHFKLSNKIQSEKNISKKTNYINVHFSFL